MQSVKPLLHCRHDVEIFFSIGRLAYLWPGALGHKGGSCVEAARSGTRLRCPSRTSGRGWGSCTGEPPEAWWGTACRHWQDSGWCSEPGSSLELSAWLKCMNYIKQEAQDGPISLTWYTLVSWTGIWIARFGQKVGHQCANQPLLKFDLVTYILTRPYPYLNLSEILSI